MDFFRAIARRSSAAVALVLFAGTLTCMTAACRVLCAAESTAVAAVTADAALPPCHRAPGSSSPESAPAPAPDGACPANSPCCARWIDDHATIDLAAPQGASLEFAAVPLDAPGLLAAPVADTGVPLPLLAVAVPAPPTGAVQIPRAPPAA